MTSRLTIACVALILALGFPAKAGSSSANPSKGPNVLRHHYSIGARIRPLMMFWIGRSGVGEAIVTKREGPSEAAYSLLIGSNPERAPRRINRWGYIREDIEGSKATLIGLMTESDEDSIEQAEANIVRQAAGERTFKIIRGTVDADEAKSNLTVIAAPAEYSYRKVQTVLDLAKRQSSEDQTRARVIRLPPGTRAGFLAAVAELMHRHVEQWRASGRVQPGASVNYVYYGRIYRLSATRTRPLPNVRLSGASYTRAIASDFEATSAYDGEVTKFSITYGTEGPLAEIPLAASYRPRWWMEIDLTLDDIGGESALGDVLDP